MIKNKSVPFIFTIFTALDRSWGVTVNKNRSVPFFLESGKIAILLFLLTSCFACKSVEIEDSIQNKTEYEIIYSADDKLCDYVQERLNNHVPNPEQLINPFSNDPFGSIKWEFNPSIYFSGGMAGFDIDNDGRQNTVINWGTHFGGSEVTTIFVFELGQEVGNQKLKELVKSDKYLGSLNLMGEIYCLEKCDDPDKCEGLTGDKIPSIDNYSPEWCPSSTFRFIPFIFNEKAYVSIINDDVKSKKNNWAIVSEYKSDHLKSNSRKSYEARLNKNVINDICYLKN